MNKFCDCTQDGLCPRYGRNMVGRMREICAGINCDLGTSAAFRLQWQREYNTVHQYECHSMNPTPLLLKTDQAPGDAVVMTAAIYSLHKAHPGKFITAVESPYPDVFQHNPDVWQRKQTDIGVRMLHMHYPAIHDSNKRGIHFMQGWCEFLGFALGIQVPLLTNRPHLYFNRPPNWPPPEVYSKKIDNYWVVCSGGKRDLTNKLWGHNRYQEVLNRLEGSVKFVQVGLCKEDHQPLGYAHDMVGKTALRELFAIVRSARGVLCGVSLLMHVAAALEKPCVVIAGGREPVQWNAYPKQHYLHTVGMLPCSSPQGDVGGACWRSRTVALGDSAILDEHLCQRPVSGTPECMTLIEPKQVADLILKINKQYEV